MTVLRSPLQSPLRGPLYGPMTGPYLAPPSVANQSLSFGALTKSGAGGYTITNSGGDIDSASIDSGDASDHWQITVTDGEAVLTPTSAGDTADLSGGPYSLVCTFTNSIDSDTATLTVSIEANTYSVRSKSELETVIGLGSASLDGKTIKGRAGAEIGGTSAGDKVSFPTTLDVSANGLTITSHDTSDRCYLRRMDLAHIGNITITKAVIRDYFTSGDTNDNTRIINFKNNASGRSGLTLTDIEGYCDDDVSTQDFEGGNAEVIRFMATEGGITNWPDLVVEDSNIHDFARAITGKFHDLTITNNDFTDATSDFISLSPYDAIGDWLIDQNRVMRAWGKSSDPQNPHIDCFQFNMAAVTTKNTNPIRVIGNLMMAKGGRTRAIQCVFIENQTTGSANFIIENNIIVTRSAHGITIERADADTEINNNTLISDTDNADTGYLPKINIIDAQGACLVAFNACPDVTLTNSASAVVRDNYEYGTDETDNEDADYALLYDGSDFGTDNISDFDDLITKLTPTTDGDLDADIGTKTGAVWYYDYDTGAATNPPILSSPVDAEDGSDAGTGSVDTDGDDGTLYFFVSTSATPPATSAIFKAGTGAADSGSQAVSGTGTQSISGGFTGLSEDTTYYAHYMHEDANGNQSNVSTADGFTTAASGYSAVAVDNAGAVYGTTTTYSGGSAGKVGTISFWMYVDAATWPGTKYIMEFRDATHNARMAVQTLSNGVIRITGDNSSGTRILERRLNTSTLSVKTWYHILISFDLATTTVDFYINDTQVSSFATSTTTDDTIPALTEVGVFATRSGSSKFDGSLSDVWIDHANYLDLTTASNRRNFIDASGKPVDVSSYGSPHLLLNNAVGTWFNNNGSGGNLTETGGSLAEAASSPSD